MEATKGKQSSCLFTEHYRAFAWEEAGDYVKTVLHWIIKVIMHINFA